MGSKEYFKYGIWFRVIVGSTERSQSRNTDLFQEFDENIREVFPL